VNGRLAYFVIAMPLLFAAGCAEETEAVVTGSITIDGEPARTGYIGFTPVDGRGSVNGGKIVDGKYTAKATIGTVKVDIRVPKVIGEQPTYAGDPNSPMTQITAETLPPKYNDQTELVLEIKPGENKKDYPLFTK
jgi:hypothetical protein